LRLVLIGTLSTFAATTQAIESHSPPLVLIPEGPAELFEASDLQSARDHGPTRIKESSTAGSAFIVTFEGGSVVRMKVLRAKRNAATVALR
jgi:hypothetical protein